jgi:hypothetical protein
VAAARVAGDEEAALAAVRKGLVDRIPVGAFDSDFTRFGRGAGIDPQYAGARVLRAVPDLGDAAVAEIEERRRDDTASVRALSRYFGPASTIFSIVASVPGDSGQVFIRRVPIEITTGGRAVPLVGFNSQSSRRN